jgi:hypothetical protein
MHCFAGCTIKDICHAIGCHLSDLFPAKPAGMRNGKPLQPVRSAVHLQDIAWRFKFHADSLWLRAQEVLNLAKDLDITEWSNEGLDMAMQAVIKAHDDIARADFLEEVFLGIRLRGLTKEQKRVHHTDAA